MLFRSTSLPISMTNCKLQKSQRRSPSTGDISPPFSIGKPEYSCIPTLCPRRYRRRHSLSLHLICPTLRSQAISVFPRRAILSNVSAMRPDTRQGNTVSCFIIPARYKITIALPAAKLCPTDAKKHRAKPISKLYTVLFFGIILCAMRILSFHGVSSRKMRRDRKRSCRERV